MKGILTLVILLILAARETSAAELHLLEVEKLDLQYIKLDPNNRVSYAPSYTGDWGAETSLEWDVALYHYLFWQNNIHTSSIGDNGPVKTVGWEWTAGIRVIPQLDIIAYHHSQHVLDEQPQTTQKYPVENGYGFRVHFITGANK